jgi:hypothetical protein
MKFESGKVDTARKELGFEVERKRLCRRSKWGQTRQMQDNALKNGACWKESCGDKSSESFTSGPARAELPRGLVS